jgi:hypothetical protein
VAVVDTYAIVGLLVPPDVACRRPELNCLPSELMAMRPRLPDAWRRRRNLTRRPSDVLYAALAVRAGRSLLTSDRRLAQATGGRRVVVCVIFAGHRAPRFPMRESDQPDLDRRVGKPSPGA